MAIDEEQNKSQDEGDSVDKLIDSALGGSDEADTVNGISEEAAEPDIGMLFPPKPAKTVAGFKYIPTGEIWSPYPLRRPTHDQMESFRLNGILKPIDISEEERDGRKYRLEDGQRRLVAAQELGYKTIPAIFRAGGDPYALALTESVTTEENPAAELFFVEDLVRRGYSQKQIMTASRLKGGAFKKLLRLANLIPALRDPFDRGELSPSIARQCANLPVTTQERLAALYAERVASEDYHGPGLTAADVKAEREAQRQASAAQTGLDGFDDGIDGDDDDEYVDRDDLVEAFKLLWAKYTDTKDTFGDWFTEEQKSFLVSIQERLGA